MDKSRVQGPTKLQGEVTISDAKNVVLPILFAALLAEEPVETQNIPKLKDVDTSMELLSRLGMKVERNGSVYIDAHGVSILCTPYDPVETMRASVWTLGPLIVHFSQGRVSLPGSCTIGACPVGLHIIGLKQLGATIKLEEGYMKMSIDGRPKGAHIAMGEASAGMTVTIMCAATLTEGTTVIENATREPEIVGTMNFLTALGVKITGQNTDRTTIEGVGHLGSDIYRVLSDRTEVGTFLVAAVISRDKTICRSVRSGTLDAILTKLRSAGADTKVGDDWTSPNMYGKRPKAVSVRTASHPTFPTGVQAQFMLLNLVAEETDFITEVVPENHFIHAPKLSRMSAHAETESNIVTCHGVETLSSVQVMATNLHAPASLVPAGYIAEGATVVDRIYHIDCGYKRIEDKLCALGANIEYAKGE